MPNITYQAGPRQGLVLSKKGLGYLPKYFILFGFRLHAYAYYAYLIKYDCCLVQ